MLGGLVVLVGISLCLINSSLSGVRFSLLVLMSLIRLDGYLLTKELHLMNTKFSYLDRDASNYNTYNDRIFPNALNSDQLSGFTYLNRKGLLGRSIYGS